jgi:hypothetical protein
MVQTQGKHLAYMFIDQTIIDDAPDLTHADNLLRTQDAQLVGDGCVVTSQTSSQVTYAQFTLWRVKQRVDNLEPGWIGKHRKQ